MKISNFKFQTLRIILLIIFILLAFSGIVQTRPDNVRGVYVNVWTMNAPAKFQRIANNSVKNGLNALVCDYEGKAGKAYRNNLKYAQDKGLYCIARIVVFTDGVGATFENVKNPENWSVKQKWAKDCEKMGFAEVQFDYIRFADSGSGTDRKKDIIEEFLSEAKATLNIPVGIDVFGSVAYQPRHTIGQDLKRIAKIIDVVSPMLYPSHFHLDKKRMSQPYETMLEGCTMAKRQLAGKQVRLIPFIQGFALRLSYSGMSLKEYLVAQLKAVKKAETDGFFIWNAGNEYKVTWQALQEFNGLGES